MRKIIQRTLNKLSQRSLENLLPGINDEISTYRKGSSTTGTQFITLLLAVKSILRYKPAHVLECGTGVSTLVLAAAIEKVKLSDPSYQGTIVSMESEKSWFDLAQEKLPAKYRSVVEIIYGPREKYEIGFFRGYVHSGIPKRDYDFILLDGPDYADENGLSFCADVIKIFDISNVMALRGVVDGRASSVFVIQTFFGYRAARYFHSVYAAKFTIKRKNLRSLSHHTPKDYRCTWDGRLEFRKFHD